MEYMALADIEIIFIIKIYKLFNLFKPICLNVSFFY